jgi:Zn ribbon nucleic-acid-binding protein
VKFSSFLPVTSFLAGHEERCLAPSIHLYLNSNIADHRIIHLAHSYRVLFNDSERFDDTERSRLQSSLPDHENLVQMAAIVADSSSPSIQPVCQNCQTSTTPLWRRDEMGSVLCNACGLFLKLHGRPRPISLKTDVIKSRNRVKSAAHSQRKKVG